MFQTASARPYNLTAGSDLNADGINSDRWIDPATGQQVSLNAGRGDPTVALDLRATKFFPLGGERRIAVFAEIFNVLDNVNLGGDFTGNARSAVPSAHRGVHPGDRLPTPAATGCPVPLLMTIGNIRGFSKSTERPFSDAPPHRHSQPSPARRTARE